MKRLFITIATLVTLLELAVPGHATVYLNQTSWTSGTRATQNLPGTSAWFSASAGSLTVSSGSLRLIVTATGAAMTYFTPTSSSSPVRLNIGDTLTATFQFTFNGVPPVGTSSQGFRLGIFNSYDGSNVPLRVSADGFGSASMGSFVEGYSLFQKCYGTFADDQPIDIKKRTNLGDSALLNTTQSFTTIGKPHLTNPLFPGFADLTDYTFQTVVQRTGLGSTAVTMTWSNMSNGATLSASGVDNLSTNFSYDTFQWRVSNGQVPSTNLFRQVKVEVASAPVAASIITPPLDQDVASGQNVTFTCEANGTLPLAYQWYFNTNTLVGSGTIDFPPTAHTPTPNPTLPIPNVQTSNAGTYLIILSNAYGSVTSSVATLLVADVPPGVASQPLDLTVIPGEYATFSVIATGSQPLSYQWYHNNTNSPLANATNSAVTLSGVSTNDAGTYSVIVNNPLGTATSSNAVLTVDTDPSAPVFITQPVSITVRADDSASLTAAAVGDQPITYQWTTNGVPVPGATSPTLNFLSAQLTDAGTYALVASNAVGTTASSNAIFTVVSRTPTLPVIPTNQYSILNYGAYGDGVSNNAAAIQAAIADASATSTGGVVIVPANGTLSTYMCGPIVLSNYVNLVVSNGATLIMLPRYATPTVASWPTPASPLIDIGGVHDVAISGSGTIDGNAGFGLTNWWQSPTLDEAARPKLINIHNVSSNILIRGVTLQNSPVFHILMKGKNVGVTIDGVTWNTPGNSPNTDAMDIGSTNVLIQNCTINVGDDNIEIGGSSDLAADITVSNCFFGTGHGVSIGSQVNGSGGGVHELLVSNCWWNGTDNGIRLKSDRGDGGLVENLRYLDLTMTNIGTSGGSGAPIVIYSYYNSGFNNVPPANAAADPPQAINGTTPIWRNITISNLTVNSTRGNNIGGIIWGLPEMVVSNVTLYNVNISAPTKTFNIYHARGIRIINSNLTAPNTTTNTLNLYDAEVIVTNTTPNSTLVTLGGLARPGTNNSLSFINSRAAITDPSMLGSGPITLANSTLTFNPDSVNSANNPITIVEASALAFTSGNNTLSGALSGSGPLTLNLPASTLLTLQADSSGFGGALVVSNSGALLVNNIAGSGTGSGAVTVLSTAKLGGNGTIGGPVTVDGTLAPGTSPGTLTINNNLVVDSGAVLQYELGTSSDLVVVSSNLTLNGTLNVTDSGGFVPNTTYPLLSYGGLLSDNGLTVGTTPNTNFSYAVDIGTAGLVKLNVTAVLTAFEQWQIQYFGSTTNPAAAGNFDADGDGISNTNEFLAGTNPTNSLSGLRIISAVRQATNVVITWATAGGRTNVVQASAGGVNGNFTTNNFVDIGGSTTIIPGSGDATTNYVDVSGATNAPTRFYRIRLAP